MIKGTKTGDNMKIHFTKMHGCGNDFIVADNMNNNMALSPEQIAWLCDRHKGIGADGLILPEKRNGQPFMNYYNTDGSTAEMCGNGMRCTARFLADNGYENSGEFIVGSRAGDIMVDVPEDDSGFISVNVGTPNFLAADVPVITGQTEFMDRSIDFHGQTFRGGCVSMGNPHLVLVSDTLSDELFNEAGKYFETAPLFPKKINVNFVQVQDPEHISVRTWERGCGPTLACGTGASASAAVCARLGLTADSVEISVPGGTLQADLTDHGIVLSGPAETVFNGEVEL